MPEETRRAHVVVEPAPAKAREQAQIYYGQLGRWLGPVTGRAVTIPRVGSLLCSIVIGGSSAAVPGASSRSHRVHARSDCAPRQGIATAQADLISWPRRQCSSRSDLAADGLQYISSADVLLFESTNQNAHKPPLRTSLALLAQGADADALTSSEFTLTTSIWRN